MNSASIEIKIIAMVVFVAMIFGLGWGVRGVEADRAIGKINLAHEVALGKATSAKLAAEEHATELEHQHATALEVATTTYEEQHEKDQAASARTIADLNSRVTSLRIRVATLASSGSVPGTIASTGGGNGEATETLAPAIAGRLAQRYADYNEIVDELNLCQAAHTIDRQQ